VSTLREARIRKGWTQTELARRVGVTSQTIYNIEHGFRKGSVTTWDRLEDVLGISRRTLRRMSGKKAAPGDGGQEV
jgi:DNA-binding XRE family transcriptional regulator